MLQVQRTKLTVWCNNVDYSNYIFFIVE